MTTDTRCLCDRGVLKSFIPFLKSRAYQTLGFCYPDIFFVFWGLLVYSFFSSFYADRRMMCLHVKRAFRLLRQFSPFLATDLTSRLFEGVTSLPWRGGGLIKVIRQARVRLRPPPSVTITVDDILRLLSTAPVPEARHLLTRLLACGS